MICARCDKPIEGEPETILADSATGAAEVKVHPWPCTRPRSPVRLPDRGRS
jgi:hypothetical protein